MMVCTDVLLMTVIRKEKKVKKHWFIVLGCVLYGTHQQMWKTCNFNNTKKIFTQFSLKNNEDLNLVLSKKPIMVFKMCNIFQHTQNNSGFQMRIISFSAALDMLTCFTVKVKFNTFTT